MELDTLKELMKKNTRITQSPIDAGQADPICRYYNNIWGVISNTHMSCKDGSYYITGSLFRDENQTQRFLYTCQWGGYTFSNSSLRFKCLSDYLGSFGYKLTRTMINNDWAAILERGVDPCQDVCCGDSCVCYGCELYKVVYGDREAKVLATNEDEAKWLFVNKLDLKNVKIEDIQTEVNDINTKMHGVVCEK